MRPFVVDFESLSVFISVGCVLSIAVVCVVSFLAAFHTVRRCNHGLCVPSVPGWIQISLSRFVRMRHFV